MDKRIISDDKSIDINDIITILSQYKNGGSYDKTIKQIYDYLRNYYTSAVFAYLQPPSSTEIDAIDTYQLVEGTFINEYYGNDFEVVIDGDDVYLMYCGEDGLYKIDYDANVTSDTNNTTAYVGISINEGVVEIADMKNFIKFGGTDYVSMSGHLIRVLVYGDRIRLMTKADILATLTYERFLTSIYRLF